MKTTTVGAGNNCPEAVLVIKYQSYNSQTSPEIFSDDAAKVFDIIYAHLPSGVVDRVVEMFLTKEMANYQIFGYTQTAQDFLKVIETYRKKF